MIPDLQMTDVIRETLRHPARFKVATRGRRSGKSREACIWLHAGDLRAESLLWYVAPYRKQAKQIMWPLVKKLARASGVGPRGISESELCVRWTNGAMTQLHGADNPDGLVGVGLARVVCDEYALWSKPDVWDGILRPMLTQSKGPAFFPSTPRGYNHHYDLHMLGQNPDKPDWMSWHSTTAESPFVDRAEVEAARADMDPWLYRQEYEASFENSGNRAAYMFDRALHIAEPTQQPVRLVAGMDFNVEPMVCLIIDIRPEGIHYIDEIVIGNNAYTELMAQRLKERYPAIRDVYPDPTGSSRSTSFRRTNHEILREAGYVIHAHRHAPEHIDRLNAFNRMLMDASGRQRIWISAKCKTLIRDCERAQRLPDGGIDKRAHDPHALDAGSYVVEYCYPVTSRAVTTQPRW